MDDNHRRKKRRECMDIGELLEAHGLWNRGTLPKGLEAYDLEVWRLTTLGEVRFGGSQTLVDTA